MECKCRPSPASITVLQLQQSQLYKMAVFLYMCTLVMTKLKLFPEKQNLYSENMKHYKPREIGQVLTNIFSFLLKRKKVQLSRYMEHGGPLIAVIYGVISSQPLPPSVCGIFKSGLSGSQINILLGVTATSRPRWSRGDVLASRPKVRRFKPG